MRGTLPVAGSILILSPWWVAAAAADESTAEDEDEISTIVVEGRRIANEEPANLFTTIATALRYDPEVDLQSRGYAESQADVSVRGGVFENTGVSVGAVTIFDPQTGHYTAAVPIDPGVLSRPQLKTDLAHALGGFNATLATLAYAWRPLDRQREVALGAGTDALRFGSVAFAETRGDAAGNVRGIEARYATSEGDGSREYGDHDFERALIRVQSRRARSRTDVAIAYQDSFFGWPGAYTGFASLPETDRTKMTLILANHRVEYARDNREDSYVEFGAFYRDLDDDYDFDRRTTESGVPGSFEHRTRSYGTGVQGQHAASRWTWQYGMQVSGDELVRSTDLTFGNFNSRRYLKATVAPEYRVELDSGFDASFQVGMTLDVSNRDENELSPLAGVSFARSTPSGTDKIGLTYVATSQVPGYTALNSSPTGLFGGNADLGRERAENLTLRYTRLRSEWQASAVAFLRRDDALVDWTYLGGAPFVRQANPVDLDIVGLEALVTRHWAFADVTVGYAYLDKEADYGSSRVDASYYALNYARHRLTASIRYHLGDSLVIHFDNEFRRQADNPLRAGSTDAYIGSLSVDWLSPSVTGLRVALIADNLTNSNFEEFPGTPAARRRASLKVSYSW